MRQKGRFFNPKFPNPRRPTTPPRTTKTSQTRQSMSPRQSTSHLQTKSNLCPKQNPNPTHRHRGYHNERPRSSNERQGGSPSLPKRNNIQCNQQRYNPTKYYLKNEGPRHRLYTLQYFKRCLQNRKRKRRKTKAPTKQPTISRTRQTKRTLFHERCTKNMRQNFKRLSNSPTKLLPYSH